MNGKEIMYILYFTTLDNGIEKILAVSNDIDKLMNMHAVKDLQFYYYSLDMCTANYTERSWYTIETVKEL